MAQKSGDFLLPFVYIRIVDKSESRNRLRDYKQGTSPKAKTALPLLAGPKRVNRKNE